MRLRQAQPERFFRLSEQYWARSPSTLWCKAFLDHWPDKLLGESRAAVLALLPAPEREAYWMGMLAQVLSQLLLEKLPLCRSHSCLRVSQDELCCLLYSVLLPTLLDAAALSLLVPTPEDGKTCSLEHVLKNNLQAIAARYAFLNLTCSG